MAVALLIIFQILYFIPTAGAYFGLLEKPEEIYLGILGLVLLWFFLIRCVWRQWRLDRFLGLLVAS